ncbi:MAG: UDP-N-acetylglucosamine 1-carboxyvinyltransferase [Oscillospiraceae bacterium]|nr:MAG: UDP-N-acetylglucosamine 1-carboxyvinyltransferase [Oscillospiraceae bacterium]
MDRYIINGGKPLVGSVEISGMKNAAVAVLFACLLVNDTCTIENVPNIIDVSVALDILAGIGVKVKKVAKNTVELDSTHAVGGMSSYELVRKMRASYYLIGAELGRFGSAYVAYPGGCDFGVRPIDQHIKGFEALGATVDVEGGYVEANALGGLRGGNIYFDVTTVGGTINVILAAARSDGLTVIENAAREPHVVDVANFLNACGARISGAGTDTIKIRGVKQLHGCCYTIIPDMIEAGTYMLAAAATCGNLRIGGVIPKHLESVIAKLIEMGVDVVEEDDSVTVSRRGPLERVNIKTQPYPGFPTDMQPQICVLMCLASGVSYLNESVWDNRFRYVSELKRMGARIKVNGKTAIIEGGKPLSAAALKACDLRAGAAMIIAGLAAPGTTSIDDVYYIERGYDDVVGKLRSVGADITLQHVPDESVFNKAN